jgi:hypothetical protein
MNTILRQMTPIIAGLTSRGSIRNIEISIDKAEILVNGRNRRVLDAAKRGK